MSRWTFSGYNNFYKNDSNGYAPLPTEEPMEMETFNTSTQKLYPDTKHSAPPQKIVDNNNINHSIPTPNPVFSIMIRSQDGKYLMSTNRSIDLIEEDHITDGVNECFSVHQVDKSENFTLQASSGHFLSFNEFGEILLAEKPTTFKFVKHKQDEARIAIADCKSEKYLHIDNSTYYMDSEPCGLQVVALPRMRASDPLYMIPAVKIKSKVWNKYFATSRRDAYKMICDQEKPQTKEAEFWVQSSASAPYTIYLKTSCSKYVGSDDEGRVVGNRATPNSKYEQFEFLVIQPGQSSFSEMAIRNRGTKGYMFAEPDGRILSDSRNVGIWEKLVLCFYSVCTTSY
eukprot:gb/GECH01012641.1/.p1 GENE.gb/GECH01012641.1/~~gb/GECH01012641.1/.p1  ORF type:complete len:342 (+),score=50.48 gb/GECH01012641.1/:1-1026(+)